MKLKGLTATLWGILMCFQESHTKEFVGCYGDGSDESDFFTPSCESPDVIVIDNIYALAKKTSSGCALAAFGANYDRGKCCTYDANDYKSVYKGISLSDYLSACAAKSSCTKPVTRQEVNTTYVDAGYMPFTTYMIMEYSCVHETSVLDPSSNKTASETTVFLQSEGKEVASDTASCTVAAPCNTSVVIESIHFFSNGSNTSLEVTDGGNSRTLLCPGNNFTGVTYVSDTSSLQITLSNMTEGTWLWAQIKGTNGEVINISCNSGDISPAETCTAAKAPSLPLEEEVVDSFFSYDVSSVCGNDKLLTTVDPRSTRTSSTDPLSGTGAEEHPGDRQSPGYTRIPLSSTGVPETGASTGTNDSWQIAVAIVLALLVLGGVAGYLIKRKMKRSQVFDLPMVSMEAPSVAPVTTTLGRHPRRLEPLHKTPSLSAPSDNTLPTMWHAVRAAYTVDNAAKPTTKIA